ncbi:MAG: hypothetical protein U1F60_14175 [Planctomycetota bacterium]
MLGLILALLSVGLVLVYGLFAWEHIVQRRRASEPGSSWGATARARAARPATEVDAPCAFGRSACWLVVPASSTEAVVQALALRTVLPANWQAGLAEAEQGGVFVSPPVAGRVFVVGRSLLGTAAPEAALAPRLARLSERFGVAAWFCADEVHDVFGWALAERGVLQRGYAWREPDGTAWWHGEVTAAEHELGCFVDDPRDRSDDDEKWWPDRGIVHALAAAWSVDPDRLGEPRPAAGLGAVGRL